MTTSRNASCITSVRIFSCSSWLNSQGSCSDGEFSQLLGEPLNVTRFCRRYSLFKSRFTTPMDLVITGYWACSVFLRRHADSVTAFPADISPREVHPTYGLKLVRADSCPQRENGAITDEDN